MLSRGADAGQPEEGGDFIRNLDAWVHSEEATEGEEEFVERGGAGAGGAEEEEGDFGGGGELFHHSER